MTWIHYTALNMPSAVNWYKRAVVRYSGKPQGCTVTWLFQKALILYGLTKMLMFYDIFPLIRAEYLSRITFEVTLKNILINAYSLGLSVESQQWILIASMLMLLIFLPLKRTYLSNTILFLIIYNFNRALFPVYSGAEMLFNLLAAINILLVPVGTVNGTLHKVLCALYNGSLWIGRLQISLVYLLSGLDKLLSETWRNGEAMYDVLHLKYYIHPQLEMLGSEHGKVMILIGWLVIVFELLFPLLVWFKKTKPIILILGVIFHLIISFTLSLPWFGSIMIISYILFLSESDFFSVLSKRKTFKVNDDSVSVSG